MNTFAFCRADVKIDSLLILIRTGAHGEMSCRHGKLETMTIAVAADHAGFILKQLVLDTVREAGHEPLDLGTHSTDAVDYPDYAEKAAHALIEKRADRAILLCGSGAGICVAANKFPGVRAATCHDTFSAHQVVEDDAVNTLCLGARIVGRSLAIELVRTFLQAQFSGADRHVRRLNKVLHIESEHRRGNE